MSQHRYAISTNSSLSNFNIFLETSPDPLSFQRIACSEKNEMKDPVVQGTIVSGSAAVGAAPAIADATKKKPADPAPAPAPADPAAPVVVAPATQTVATPATVSVTEGDSIICLVNDVGAGANSAIYRFTSPNILRYYTTQTILSAWNPANTPSTKLDCDGMTLGEPMQLPDTQTAPVSSNSTVPATYNSSATAETV